jgi:uncharacterized protein YciI
MRFVYCCLDLSGYLGGPFEDRTGGLMSFDARARKAAEGLVADDPFQQGGLVEDWRLQVWSPQ